MTPRSRVLGVAILLVVSCGDPSGPVAGDLLVRMSGPGPARAISFRLVGARTQVSAPHGTSYRVFTSELLADTVGVIVVAPSGQRLAPGPIARVAVPDARTFSGYIAIVSEVAAPSYALQQPTLYSLAVVRP